MKFLRMRLPLLAALLLAACAIPAAGQDAVTAPTLPDPKLTPGDTLMLRDKAGKLEYAD